MAFTQVNFTGYPQTACINFIACSIDGRLYTLFAWPSAFLAPFMEMHGCHWPHCWTSGIRYLPCSSRLPIITGWPLTVIITSSAFCTANPCFVNIDTLPSSFTLPTLNSKLGKSSNVWASAAAFGSFRIGRGVTFVALLIPLLATLTRLVDFHKMGIFSFALSALLM